MRNYGSQLPFRTAVIFGGVSINTQIAKLRKGVDVVVATPGRLLDHMQQRTIDLSKVELLVLDEADRMLDMGSATFSDDIRRLAKDLLNEPVEIEVAQRNKPADRVHQLVHPVDKRRKRQLLSERIRKEDWRQVLVFTRTKHGANRLAEQLAGDGVESAAIHGNKSQGARTRALADFKSGKVRVLVATDIAARGLDIDKLPYVHRIGRTARAGEKGHAVSLVCVDEENLLKDIEKVLGSAIEKKILKGYEPDSRIKAEPLQQGRGNRPGNNRSKNSRPRRSGSGSKPRRQRRAG